MNKNVLVIFVILAFIISGCAKKEADSYTLPTEKTIEYGNAVSKIKKELYEKHRIDIEPVLNANLIQKENIKTVEYEITECNFISKEDILVKIDVCYIPEFIDCDRTIICAYVRSENKMIKIFEEYHKYAQCRPVNILGNSKNQLEIISDDSGNGRTLENIRIFSYREDSESFDCVFDEILCAYNYPSAELEYISFENEYSFKMSADGKTQDIEFSSKIYKEENKILKKGKTKFTYNGKKYVAEKGFDYKDEAKRLATPEKTE